MGRNVQTFTDFLLERREQLNLPFEEPEYASKSIHDHLLDALDDLKSRDAKIYKSHEDAGDAMRKAIEEAQKTLLDSDDTVLKEYVHNVLFAYDPKDKENLKYYNRKTLKEIKDDGQEFDELWELAEYIHENIKVKDLFTKLGMETYYTMGDEKFNEDVAEMWDTVETASDKDPQKLIDCWRTVEYTKGSSDDIYTEITKEYGGVGVYWAWDEDKAEAYWGSSGGHSITLHGKVSVENVDWVQTVYRSAYDLREEHEIRVKDAGDIMIVGFNDDVIKKYIELEEPVVVKTGKETR